MKAEDKILERLAEYLQKTDRLLDRMERTDRNMERTNRNVETMSRAILDHSTKFNTVSEQILQSNQSIKRLEEDNKAILGELLSISKRVSRL